MEFMWTTFHVRDLEKSINFYHKLLGLPISGRFGSEEHQIVMLGAEDAPKVELITDVHRVLSNVGTGVSVGFSYENLDALVETLQKEGFEVVGPISPNPQMRFFFVKDPDGYEIQLIG